MKNNQDAKWQVLSSRMTYQDQWLNIRSDRCKTASGKVIEPYHVLQYPDWVNIVAITPDMDVVLVKQYRHGSGKVLLELPSGSIEPKDTSVEAAARRELLEETGYSGGTYFPVVQAFVNPAKQNNQVYTFLAVGVTATSLAHPDETEDIEIVLTPFQDFVSQQWCKPGQLQVMHGYALYAAIHLILGDTHHELQPIRQHLLQTLRYPPPGVDSSV